MAKLTKDDVLHVAKLAKLDLTENEINKFLPQLSSIVDHIGELSKVDTSGVEPTSQTTGLENVFRGDDITATSFDQNTSLSGTDNTYNGYFKVPAILSERTDK
jgi:aspartyl-tRNA(Asn)/glutamyl-tRNA(Gln) amidotransferase subunit C